MNIGPRSQRAKILVLAFSPIASDARVLRQARALGREHSVTVCGFGPNPFGPEEKIEWHPVAWKRWENHLIYPLRQLALLPGLIFRRCLKWNEVIQSWWRGAAEVIRRQSFDVIVCNDTETISLGVEAKRRRPETKLVVDLHEYATRQCELSRLPFGRRVKYAALELPVRKRLLSGFAPHFDGVMTVNEVFAELYQREYGLKKPVVVMNAPEVDLELPMRMGRDEHLDLIHHGALSASREPERMIRAVGLCSPRVRLHFMFVNTNRALAQKLKAEAGRVAAGRVHFHSPVKPEQLAATIARFDAGIYLLPPGSFNELHALPNKFFDFIAAGLPIAVSPNVCMAEIVKKYQIGFVAEDYSPEAMARVIEKFTVTSLQQFRVAVAEARRVLNGQNEAAKVQRIVNEVLAG